MRPGDSVIFVNDYGNESKADVVRGGDLNDPQAPLVLRVPGEPNDRVLVPHREKAPLVPHPVTKALVKAPHWRPL